ncbi:MAG: cytochrome d ubiquinol oxidase subunit II [Pseudomonadota bacterium]
MEPMLPLIFMALMGIAMLAYVVLDGFDLGVGLLLPLVDDADKDRMIASIGPFWDANETWLVLGVGILLVAFPHAHGVVLTALYLPVAFMLAGLILRGVAFDFRVKAHADHKALWNRAFVAGSALAAFAQGYMLGKYVLGFAEGLWPTLFAVLIGACLMATYTLLGATWLLMKTGPALKRRAAAWARRALWGTALGLAAVSVATPLVSERIFDKWFAMPQFILLLQVPLATAVLLLVADRRLKRLCREDLQRPWEPFACAVGLLALAALGLAYSLYPFLVVDRLTAWQAAAAPESLKFILVGVLITLPAIVAYSVYVYRVFWGESDALSYE